MQLSYPLDAAAYEKEWSHGSKVATSDTWGQGLDANGAEIMGL